MIRTADRSGVEYRARRLQHPAGGGTRRSIGMEMTERALVKIAGMCGILGPIIAFGSIATSVLLHPWFSWADNALSDLGAIGTSYNRVFNFAPQENFLPLVGR